MKVVIYRDAALRSLRKRAGDEQVRACATELTADSATFDATSECFKALFRTDPNHLALARAAKIVPVRVDKPKPQPKTQPAAPQRTGSIQIDGPAMWQELHTWARTADLSTVDEWVERFSRRLPCGDCRRDWRQFLVSNPPRRQSHETLFAWSVDAHNAVNAKLGKPRFNYEAARQRWGIPGLVRVHLFGGLGDATAASGALRDLKLAHPKVKLHVRHWAAALFDGCPWVDSFEFATPVRAREVRLRKGEHLVNVPVSLYGAGDIHLQELYASQLREATGLDFPTTRLGGSLALTNEEKAWRLPWPTDKPVVILDAGCKQDFELKLPHTGELQRLVDMTRDRFTYVQVGGRDHYHPRIEGAYDFIRPHGPESRWRDFRWTMVAMNHAVGCITPVSWPMHLCAAMPGERWCVVLGGGRENPNLTRYPGHVYLSTIGELDCCQSGACWKMKVSECAHPIDTDRDGMKTGECMRISAERILEATENL